MKLHVISDLHIDYNNDRDESFIKNLNPAGIDALVLAGDTMDAGHDQIGRRTDCLKRLCQLYPYVFTVMGNHDYYGSSFKAAKELNKDYEFMFKNLVVLEAGRNYIHEATGIKFAGSTMWYRDSEDVQLLKGSWPDFRFIRYSKSEIFSENTKFRNALMDLEPPWRPDVVITHMAPSPLSIHKDYFGSRWNAFFMSDETALIQKIKPKLWIHGHTHHPFDYKIDDTRIFCNPRGYPRENANPYFLERMLVEV